MQFSITNEAKGNRVVHTPRGHRTLEPKQTIQVELEAPVAMHYARLMRRGSDIVIDAIDDEAHTALMNIDMAPVGRTPLPPTPPEQNDEGEDVLGLPPQSSGGSASAEAELLGRSENMDDRALRDEAKLVLGKRWPGGQPSRKRVLTLLGATE